MLRKTIIATAAIAAIALVGAGAAQANHRRSASITVKNDDVTVYNHASAEADTGDNSQDVVLMRRSRSGSAATQTIRTGDAGADALSDATVNSTYIEAGRNRGIMVDNDDTYLMNGAEAEAETGENEQDVRGATRRRAVTQTTNTGSATAVSTGMARVNMTDLRINR